MDDEKLEMQHDAIELELEPLVHFPDVEIGTESPRSLRASTGPRGFISVMGRRFLFIFRDAVRAINRSMKPGEAKTGSGGLMVFIFGFTTSRHDSLRETAWLDGLRGVAAFLVMVYRKLDVLFLLQMLTPQITTWICLLSPLKHLTGLLKPAHGNFGDYLISESSGVRVTLKSASSSFCQASFYPGQAFLRSVKDDMRNSHSH